MRSLVAPVLAVLLHGCAMPPPDQSLVQARPQAVPVRTSTTYSEALQCMDRLFAELSGPPIPITSTGLPDRTGQVTVGTREMLISAISRLTLRSRVFTYIDIDNEDSAHYMHQIASNSVALQVRPVYYIRGSISQLDQNLLTDRQSAGIATPFGGLGFGRTQASNIISLDLNVGWVETREIIPGASASNTLVISRRDRAVDGDLEIEGFGGTLSVSVDRSEGLGQAVRTLIDLTVIEVLGKLANVPYWTCLGIATTDPKAMRLARERYEQIDQRAQLLFVAEALRQTGYFQRPNPTSFTPELRAAVSRYQQDHNLPPVGLINFDLFYALMNDPKVTVAPFPPTRDEPNELLSVAAPAITPVVPSTLPAGAPRVGITGNGIDKNPMIFAVGSKLTLRVWSDRPAHVACYYKSASGRVSRIFPNNDAPEGFLTPGQEEVVPRIGGSFSIGFLRSGAREKVACFGAERPFLDLLPEPFARPALDSIPARDIDDIRLALQRSLGGALGEARLDMMIQ